MTAKINFRDEPACVEIIEDGTNQELLSHIEKFGENKDILDISYTYAYDSVHPYRAMIIYYDESEGK